MTDVNAEINRSLGILVRLVAGAAVRTLPTMQEKATVLQAAGMTAPESAEALGATANAVQMALKHSRKAAKKPRKKGR